MMPHSKQENRADSEGRAAPNDGSMEESLQQQLDWSHRRIQQLLDESRRYQSDSRDLRAEVNRLEQEHRRLVQLLSRAERLLRAMDKGIRSLQQSLSLQLGYLITQSFRSFRGMVALPVRLFRFLMAAGRGRAGAAEPLAQLVSVPLPHDWFPSAMRREMEAFRVDYDQDDAAPNEFGTVPGAARPSTRFAALPEALHEIRMASVMDEFTFSAYRDCCQVTQLTPDGWREALAMLNPHLLFIESAWEGKDGTWLRKVSGASAELRELTAYCRQTGIPVVFWSKEDPVHFKTFLATARLADVVFTTDIDCIKHYKTELRHDRVYLLPFATQPLAHNPLERYERKPGFCFAGSYYVRYPTRQRDFASLLRAAIQLGPVDIYDRNHGKDHPNYIFPEEYRRYILGNLTFEQIDLAYKGYDFGININTVKHSQSMFARRVFDLLASNTTTVSNYSRGMRLMFGDLVISSDDSEQLLKRLGPVISDVTFRRKHRLAGLRKVLLEHAYQHRLAYVIGKTYGSVPHISFQADIAVLARVGNEEDLRHTLENFHRQLWQRKRLVLCFDAGFNPRQSPMAANVQILSSLQASVRIASMITPAGYLAGFHPHDYYGQNYLVDLALAGSYSSASVIGKAAYYHMQSSEPKLISDGVQYRISGPIARRRSITLAARCGDVTIASWLDAIDAAPEEDSVAIDEFNYCAEARGTASCSVVDDLTGLDEGIPVETLLTFAEGIKGEPLHSTAAGRDESAGLPGLEASELSERLGIPDSKYMALIRDDDGLVLQSNLPQGQHAYAYLSGTFSPRELHFTDIARMQLVCDGDGDGVSLVLVYLDIDAQKISHSLLKSAVNVTVAVPPGTYAVQVGLRISKPGEFRIRRLTFEHVPLAVDTMVTRSRYLLVAKNYPSYGDLYKHAFVHRRVLEYRRRGIDVDVFRIGANGLSFYEFEGVDVVYGQADHLRAMLRSGRYESVMAHVLDETMWGVLQEFIDHSRIYVWAHGSEIQSASRRECDHVDEAARARALALGERRMQFWRRIFQEAHPNLRLVFVSSWSAKDVMDDVGVALPQNSYQVVHNFIDPNLFAYRPKPAEQRKKILSIRPFTSRVYANDLTVEAILKLSRLPFFGELEFRIIGDGPLFDQTVGPLRRFGNVLIERRFLAQAQIAELHREYGVFLVPSRMDSQGVSRDEAMASGLVPVTSLVAAIPEFVDASCGILTDAEDAQGLADGIERLYRDPDLFMTLSAGAAERVRRQSGYERTIAREIALFQKQVKVVRVDG